jgi:hypothetical protein
MFKRKISIKEIQEQELRVFRSQQFLDKEILILNEYRKEFYLQNPEFMPSNLTQQQLPPKEKEPQAKKSALDLGY